MSRIYHHKLRVPASAVDEQGHVNNAEHLRWMQDAASAHSALSGWPLEKYKEISGLWVVRSHLIEYLRPVRKGDLIEIRTWVEEIRRSQSTRRYHFVRLGENREEALATAHTIWIFVDYHTGRPRSVPAELSAALTFGS